MIWTIIVALMAGYIAARTMAKLVRADARRWREQVVGPGPDLSLLDHDPLLEEFHQLGMFTPEERASQNWAGRQRHSQALQDLALGNANQSRIFAQQQGMSQQQQGMSQQQQMARNQQGSFAGLFGSIGSIGGIIGGFGGAIGGQIGDPIRSHNPFKKKNPFNNPQ